MVRYFAFSLKIGCISSSTVTLLGRWPACIYDPRLTVGAARMQSIKNLGKKHLVYFFECAEAPFEMLADHKILSWEQGLLEDCHLGKSARSTSKARLSEFRCAMHAASIEENKARDRRLDWNHQGQLGTLTASPARQNNESSPRRGGSSIVFSRVNKGIPFLGDVTASPQNVIFESIKQYGAQRKRKRRSEKTMTGVGRKVKSETENSVKDFKLEKEMYCKVLRQEKISSKMISVGFVRVHSREKSTFAHLRRVIEQDLIPDAIPREWDWRFLVPNLGPLSIKQETKFGALLTFLHEACPSVGEGSLRCPIKITLVDAPMSSK